MSISFSGLASGLDTSSWVTSLTALRQAKITTLEEQKSTIATAQSTLQGIRSFFSSFRSTIEKITDSKFNVSTMDIFSRKVATSSNLGVLTATAKATAAEGSYEVKVDKIATQTQVKSGYRYKTTLVSTTQATTSSLFKNIGVGYGTDTAAGIGTGDIEITHDGVTSRISIDSDETMQSFLDKLTTVGINAAFDNSTGIFSIDVNAGDINDVGHTDILNKLKIQNINYGYTGNQIRIEDSHEEYHQAENSTLLSELGVSAGTLYIRTNEGDYEVTLEDDDTIGSLVSALRSEGIEATFNDGIFKITNAYITNDGETGLIEHFGLTSPDIVSQTQVSGGLSYQSVYTQTTVASADSYLKDIDGVNLTSNQTINVKDANGNTSTITVGVDTKISDLVSDLNNAGLNATFDSTAGTLNITDGWIITGGTFDVGAAFGLEYVPVPVTVTGSSLTVTTTTVEGATKNTKLKDLTNAVTSGNIDVTDTMNVVHHLSIDNNSTIGDFVNQIKALGLGAEFDNTTGVLTLVGGTYSAVANGVTPKSNLLQVFYGSDELDPSSIDSATSISQSLREMVTNTHAAEGTTSLGTLGMTSGNYTATFRTGNTDVELNISGDTTLNELVSTLRSNGIDAAFNAVTGLFTMSEGEFIGVTGGNFASLMNFATTTTGAYATSKNVVAETVTTANELTSAGTVNKTVFTTTTITHTSTSTTAQASQSAPITYQTVTTTTTGHTEGISVTGATLTYNSVITTGASQTGGLLSYVVVNSEGGTTTTVSQSVTSGVMYVDVTTGRAQTGDIMSYQTVTGAEGTTTTVSQTVTSGVLLVNSTTGRAQTGDIMSYQTVTGADGTTATVGQTVTGEVLYTPSTAGISQTGHTLTYQTITGVDGTITTIAQTVTSGVLYTHSTVAIGQTGDNLFINSTVGIIATSGTLYVSGTVGIGQRGGCIAPKQRVGTIDVGLHTDPLYFANRYVTGGVISTYATVTQLNEESVFNSILTYTTTPTEGIDVSICGSARCPSGRLATFADIGLVDEGYIVTNRGTVTVLSTDTIDDVNYKLTGDINTPILSVGNYDGDEVDIEIKSTKELYIMDIDMQADWISDFSPVGEGYSYRSLASTVVTADARTTLGELGMSGAGSITIFTDYNDSKKADEYKGTYTTLNYDSTTELGDLFKQLKDDYGIEIYFSDGTISQARNLAEQFPDDYEYCSKITNISSNLASALELYDLEYDSESRSDSYFAHADDLLSDFYGQHGLSIAGNNGNIFEAVGMDNIYIPDGLYFNEDGQPVNTIIEGDVSFGSLFDYLVEYNFVQDIRLDDDGRVIMLHNDDGEGILNIQNLDSQSHSSLPSLGLLAGRDYALDCIHYIHNYGLTCNDYIKTSDGVYHYMEDEQYLENYVYQLGYGFSSDYSSLIAVSNFLPKTIYITDASENFKRLFNLDFQNNDYSETASLTPEMTNGDLGLTETGYIDISNGNAITISPTDTYDSIIDLLDEQGVAASWSANYELVISPPSGSYNNYITSVSSSLQNFYGIRAGNGYSYTVASSGVTITSDTTLAELGMTGTGVITTNLNTIQVDGSTAISDLGTLLGSNFVFDVTDGEIMIGGNSTEYITNISSNLSSAIGISDEDTYVCGRMAPTGDTTLAELGFTGTGYAVISNGQTVTISSTDTIINVAGKLSSQGVIAGLSTSLMNSQFSISSPSENAIVSMTSTLADVLGIRCGEGDSYNTINGMAGPLATLARLGMTSQNGQIVVDNDTTININNTMSISDVNTALGDNFTLTIGTSGTDMGRIFLSATDGHYVKSMSPSIAQALGLTVGNGYSYIVESNSPTSTTETVTATVDTFLYQLNFSGPGTVVSSNGNMVIINSTGTIGDVVSDLQVQGINASFTDGILSIGTPNSTYGNYITSISANAESLFGISAGDGNSYSISNLTATSASTLAQLGMDSISGYIVVDEDNTITINNTMSISEINTALGNNFTLTIGTSGTDQGKVFLSPAAGHYVKAMSADVQDALGLATGYGNSYIVDIQASTYTTETVTATTDTALAFLGLTGSGSIVSSNGMTININSGSTIGDVVSNLQGKGINASFANGVLSIGAPNSNYGNYISSMSSNVAYIFGIEAGNGSSYDISTVTANENSTLADLGMTGSQGQIVTDAGTIGINSTMSISDINAALGENYSLTIGISGTDKGKVFLSAAEGHYIKSMTSTIAAALGLETGYGNTYNVVVNAATYTTNTVNATAETYLSTLGFSGSGNIVSSNGVTININSGNTIGEVVSYLQEEGINASFSNGQLSIGAPDSTYGNYIVSMSSSIEFLFGIESGAGDSYTVSGVKATSESTLAQLGMVGQSGQIVTDAGVFGVTRDMTISQIDSILGANYNLTVGTSGTDQGKIFLNATEGHYIKSMTSNLSMALGLETGYGTSYVVNVEAASYTTSTIAATGSTALSLLGFLSSGRIVSSNGETVNISSTDTINSVVSALQGIGINANFSNEIHRLSIGEPNLNYQNYITSMSSNVAALFGLEAGEGASYLSITVVNTATSSTTLAQLGFSGSASIITDTGTVNVNENMSLNEINTALGNNYRLTVGTGSNAGKVTLTAANPQNHYIKSISPALAATLGLDSGMNVSYNVIDEVCNTATVTATELTSMGVLGLTSNGFIITDNNTLTISTTDTIYSLVKKSILDLGITADYNEGTGVLTLGNSTDEHYIKSISTNLSSVLGNITAGENYTYHYYDVELTETVTTSRSETVATDDTFGTIGVSASGGVINLSNGQSVTVNDNTTIASFISDMAAKGINVSLNNGIFQIQSSDGTFITGSSGENILNEINIFGSTYSTNNKSLGNTKLKDLRDSENNLLGITSGAIQAYKNGIAHTINIDNEDTLDELAAKLSSYNIQMVYGSGNSGNIYFTGTGDSYLKSISGGSNLLSSLDTGSWTKIKDSTSQKLEYTTNDDEVINGNTRLVNLKDSFGNSLGITTGKYKVVAGGINYEGNITNNTTVNDFFTDLSRYGISGSINSDGQITLNTSNDDTYLEVANGAAGYSTIVDQVFPSWLYGNIYTADAVDVTTITTTNMTSETRLRDIDGINYQAGKFVVSNSISGDTTLSLSENATVGDFMAAISYYGFNSYIENGRLIVRNDGSTTLKNYATPSEASNIISAMGLTPADWEQPGYYTGSGQTATTYHTTLAAVTRETKLSELRDSSGNALNITTGEYYVYSNGVRHTLNLSSADTTLDSFINKLAEYGINTILNTEGNQATLRFVGSGDSYVESSSSAAASNVVNKLFSNPATLYHYEGYEQTTEIVSTTVIATLGTMLSDYDQNGSLSQGIFAFTVDGNYNEINITNYETFGSLLEKFERVGVQATLDDGIMRLETGNREFILDSGRTTSNLLNNLGLSFSNNLGGFAASNAAVTHTTTTIEDRTLSVARYADDATQLGLLNISSGTISIYRNGQKKLINIDNTETFSQLRSKIQTEFSDVNIDFDNGILRFYSTTEGIDVQVGSTNDSSNMASICGLSQDENGYIVSARELYKVNASSKVTTAGLFRNGDVREGTFIIGDETINITNDTTIQNIVAQINASENSNASAYWDSVDGKLVISSRTTGASVVNIEAGTSNFTDIIGLTTSEWNSNNTVKTTKILRDAQELGSNAKFSINGTNFSSASNVITSDISRIQGMTINLKGASAGETVTISVEKDKEAIAEAVGGFVDAYNELVENVDAELSATGALKDQSTLKFIRQQIRNLLVNTFAGATTFRNLAAIGISTGTANAAKAGDTSVAGIEFLTFNAETFLEAYNKDGDAVRNMLVGSDATPGILIQIENIVENALATGSGYFASANKSYTDKIAAINDKITKENKSIEAYRARLENKFQSMDMLISQMQNQYSSFLST